jgi:hypothetical protein
MPGAEGGPPARTDIYVSPVRRPSGMMLMVLGWLAVAASVGLALWSLGERVPPPYGLPPDLDALSKSAVLMGLAGDALWAGFFLLLAGCVVRAIWFIPGADTKRAP